MIVTIWIPGVQNKKIRMEPIKPNILILSQILWWR